jgi:hypothetical protein
VAGERRGGAPGAVVGQDPAKLDPDPASRSARWSTTPAASRADRSPATRAPIPARVAVSTTVSCQTGPMPRGWRQRSIQGDQIPRAGGEAAEPERPPGRGGGGRHDRWPATLGQQRGQPGALAAAGPAVVGGARDAEGAAGLGQVGLAGPVQDLDTPVGDALCWGHGGGLLRLFGRNQGSTTGPTNGGTRNLIPYPARPSVRGGGEAGEGAAGCSPRPPHTFAASFPPSSE